MPEQSCAPPDSLMLWAAALLAGTGLLVVVALALESARWGPSRGWLALRLPGALLAVGLAGWSLLQYARVQALYALLFSQYEWNPDECFGGTPAYPSVWRRLQAAQIAPYQRAALITICAAVVFIVVVAALAALRWLRHRRPMRAPIRWRVERARALSLILLLALILASLGDFTVIQVQSVMARMALNTPCPSAMTAADIQNLRDAGIALIPSHDTMPVSADQARTTSRQGLGNLLPANSVCIGPQLYFVDHSTRYEAPRFAIVWVVGYRTPATKAGPGVPAEPPTTEWTFVDAQSGEYLGNVFMSVVGG